MLDDITVLFVHVSLC